MTDRRYSIIPARAVTDERIERGDLRVLAYLGTFTDKLGWCFLAQGTIADALNCGRSTVQRSLTRLVDAGWVQVKAATVSGRPHACHAYRVVMDNDDPAIGPSEFEVEDQEREGGCPPVGTQGAQPERAGVPAQDGHGVPTHARAQKDQDSDVHEGVGCARVSGQSGISAEAHAIAAEIATIAGHDLKFLPPRWMSDGPAMRVQMMLDHGWPRDLMIETAKAVMAAKRDGPPLTIKYFERPFAAAHARQSKPEPLPTVPSDLEATNAAPHVQSARRPSGPSHSSLALAFARRASDIGGPGG